MTFQQKKLKSIFQIEIPTSQQNNLEHYITVIWKKQNQNIRNFIILEILDFNIVSKQQLVRGKDFNMWNWSVWFEIEFMGYSVHPGMCIDLDEFDRQELDSFPQTNNIVSQKIILSPKSQDKGMEKPKTKKELNGSFDENRIPCIREYKKMDTSKIYQVSVCQDYVGFYFLLKQIYIGYQACDLDLSSGAKQYDYEKNIIEPVKSNVQVNKHMYEKNYPILEDYDLIKDYTLDNFKKWFEEKKNIIVPIIRLDKTIMVSKKSIKNEYTQDDYEKLFWLIQLQQKFINKMIQKNFLQ